MLTVRFLTELALFAGLAVAGALIGSGVVLHIVDAVLWPAVAIAVWALWCAPRARYLLPDPARLAVEVVLFAGVGVALAAAGYLVAGVVVGVVGIGTAAAVRAVVKDG